MALKSSNKVDTNVYEIEVTVAPEEFTQACKDAYLSNCPASERARLPRV